MADLALYRLHLGRALSYRADSTATADIIMVFSNEALVMTDSDRGPSIVTPLSEPLFSGGFWPLQESDKPGKPEMSGKNAITDGSYVLAAGDYVFCQWRQKDFASIEEGLGNFVQQVWWEQRESKGPWILRCVEEDGGQAFQGLRAVPLHGEQPGRDY